MSNEEYVFDDVTGDWMPQSQFDKLHAERNTVKAFDAQGNELQDGDQVALVKDLPVKGAGQTLKRGTVIKSIRLTDNPEEIDCKYEGIKGLVLRTEFVQKK